MSTAPHVPPSGLPRVVSCRRMGLGTAVLLSLLGAPGQADEGMWTLTDFPRERIQRKYGFNASDEWMKKVQLSSLRLANGCSGAFVSDQGLVMSNHHCVSECIVEQSSSLRDLNRNGYYASTNANELKCSSLELNQLLEIEDVTAKLQAVTRGLSDAEFGVALRREISHMEMSCASATKLRCDVVSLYHGGKYHLYKYRRFSDVRLVFLPETGTARFGGDPDNFNYPRYSLDVSFVRVYENGQPLRTPHYFPVNPVGVAPGELVFSTGNPGSTQRLMTVSQLEFLRDVQNPDLLLYLAELRGHMLEFARLGPEQRRITTEPLYGVENWYKSLLGQQETLVSRNFLSAKRSSEEALRSQVAQNPDWQKRFGGAWDALSRSQEELRKFYKEHSLLEGGRAFNSTLFHYARQLVRGAEERPKPSDQRLSEYRDSALESLSHELLARSTLYPQLEILTLSYSLGKLREALGPNHPFIKETFGPYSPEEIARNLIGSSRLADASVRKALWEGGAKALTASTDPMIRFAKAVDAQSRLIRRQYQDTVESVEKKNSELVAQALFAVQGTSVYPDATFSLRVTYGTVRGYKEAGTELSPITLLGGAFERHTGREPFVLPGAWLAAKSRLKASTPLNFVSTLDIIGGNSGSPVLNRDAQVVGVIFDGNLQSLGGAFFYDDTANRAIAVHTSGLFETLRGIYNAQPLVKELQNAANPTQSAPVKR